MIDDARPSGGGMSRRAGDWNADMNEPIRERICALLSEALHLLDSEAATVAAIHVSHAMDTIDCVVSDPACPNDVAATLQSRPATSGSSRDRSSSKPASSHGDR